MRSVSFGQMQKSAMLEILWRILKFFWRISIFMLTILLPNDNNTSNLMLFIYLPNNNKWVLLHFLVIKRILISGWVFGLFQTEIQFVKIRKYYKYSNIVWLNISLSMNSKNRFVFILINLLYVFNNTITSRKKIY